MSMNLTRKIIAAHRLDGDMNPGGEVALRIDQTLTQDATGTMAHLQFEAIGVPRVRTELSVSYVDHNTLQMGFRNPDDHRYLRTVAARYGIVFSPAGTGICHQLHLENFARPGRTLIGSDSHTPTAGGVGSLAMGAGGLSVALAMAGEPYVITMPRVVEVHLTGRLGGWATAKDIILHLLGELSVKGGVGRVMEYTGPGAATLTVPERATITNMGAELGATTSIFPSDGQTRAFLRAMGREEDFEPLAADPGAAYDERVEIDLCALEPLVAAPHMPDRRVPVRELAGLKVDQAAIGSCTNSSYADLKTVALMLAGRRTAPGTDLLISPGSKQVLTMLAAENLVEPLLASGARLLECTCGPCIGMGGSPVSAGVSVRTFNRNFEGRSGTQDAQVYLASPQTAAMCALRGEFSDPATWGEPPAAPAFPARVPSIRHLFLAPPADEAAAAAVEVLRGPNIVALETFDALPGTLDATVTLKVGDNITTDHILPAGAQITALRSNIPAISEYIFSRVDEGFVARQRQAGCGVIVGGENYGQGSSREHAALGPRHLGVRAVLVKSLARIHRANLVNFGILPLLFADPADYERVAQGAALSVPVARLAPGGVLELEVAGAGRVAVRNDLTENELAIIQAGGLLNHVRARAGA
ncbi:aconitate hydratase [Desulfocurvus sp.]|uniref:aconitate hydratase n=1 Tax=Desulfocurvus sp. TaxID=2871698 RepID=UPI0025C41EC4|nr:aconitate hydratase [Desulfocurvus sp.]MCK9239384.1 aconitate hydratase [Desulfocurvus sp.]